MNIMIKVESLLPRKFSDFIQRKLSYGGELHESRKKVGFIVTYPFFVGLMTAIVAWVLFPKADGLILIGSYVLGLIISFGGMYLLIDYQASVRAKKIEENLPDALELISVNINSGQTIENSLVESARPEFGELAFILRKTAKDVFAGTTIEKAFGEIGKRIESEALRRTILLIGEGMKKGASLGELLLRISNDLRGESALKKEIGANISMYIMLIIIATAVGAPVMFSAGTVVALSFTKQTIQVDVSPAASKLPLFSLFGGKNDPANGFSAGDIETLSVIALTLTCLFASLIIGVIMYNKESAGIRFFPILLLIALAIFYTSVIILKKMVLGI